jgi:signal transduction histidine kinase
MLNTQEEIRFLGLRYRTVFLSLSAIVSAVAALMILRLVNLATEGSFAPTWGNVLGSSRAGWTEVLALAILLLIIVAAALLTVYSYFSTAERLASIRTTSRAILESLVGGVLTLDTEGHITIINRAAARILELPSQAPYPHINEFALGHPQIAEAIRLALDRKEYAQDMDSAFVNSEGAHLILRTTVSAQLDENGRGVGLVVLVKDVSGIVALEQELRKRDRLAAAGSLAAGVAHEIRNPLSAIELNLGLLRDEAAPALAGRQDLEEYFEILFVETQRLNRITTNFLQFSRPELIEKSRLGAREPLTRVVKLLQSEAKSRGIEFQMDFHAGGAEVLGDSTKLEQVCLNILINSMQAMPDGGNIRIATRLSKNEGGDWVELVISDQGIGIPPENVDYLFDPYFTTRSDGTGLGLAIAHRIVADHGGTIVVDSVPSAGTTMTVRLPMTSHTVASGRQ